MPSELSQEFRVVTCLPSCHRPLKLSQAFRVITCLPSCHRPVTNPNCCDSVRSKARGITALSEQTELLALYRLQCQQQVQSTLSAPLRRLGGVEAQLHSQLISAPDRGEWSTSCPVRLTPRKGACTDGTAGLMDPRVRLEVFCRSEYLLPCRDTNPLQFIPKRIHYSN
jgi:hypothetical protein